jgi:hypothetical protein
MLRVIKSEPTNTPWYTSGGCCIMIGCSKNKDRMCKAKKGKSCLLLDIIKNDRDVTYTVFEADNNEI